MKIVTMLLTTGSLLIASVVYSHSGATGIVKERMDAMQDMGDKSKIVGDMFKGKTVFNRNALVEAAESFASHGTRMRELFPDTKESRTGSKTEALPQIWEEWDEFNALVMEFIDQSESLKTTVTSTENEQELKKAFFQTTRSCSGCHKRFRKPKD